MYSSVFGGIILDPAMMVIPIDDHMVHRGHGIFDTAIILDGQVHILPPMNSYLSMFAEVVVFRHRNPFKVNMILK